MALEKEIELENGIIVNYHRVVSLNKVTNINNIIEIASYTSAKKRQEEKEYYEDTENNKSINVYIDTNYINKEYDENETIKDAYDYLKTTDKFKNAENV